MQKWKTERLKAVNPPQANKERTFHVHLLVKSFCIVFQITFYDEASGSALFLIFHHNLLLIVFIFIYLLVMIYYLYHECMNVYKMPYNSYMA